VQDNGEPGHNVDQFTIAVDGGPAEGSTITKGNIQIRNAVAQNLGDTSADCDSAVALAGSSPSTSGLSGSLTKLWTYVRSTMNSFATVLPGPIGLTARAGNTGNTGNIRDRSPTTQT
jgi:hypothetical protein